MSTSLHTHDASCALLVCKYCTLETQHSPILLSDLRIEYVLELDRHVDVNLRRLYAVVDQSQETIVKGSHVFKAQNSFEEVGPIRVYIMVSLQFKPCDV